MLEFGTGALQLTPPGLRNFYQWHAVSSSSYGYAIFTMPEEHPGWLRFRTARPDDIVVSLLDHVLWLDSQHPDGSHRSATVALAYAIRAFVTRASSTRHPTVSYPT
ncbi:hypothetical protein GCM10023169_24030 [Georgenia halophila]|uniref:Uncharacterized protein n=1 Tax=Georgenia halophila TaxID=620889 RepID=A0ABP8LAT8_9MICO